MFSVSCLSCSAIHNKIHQYNKLFFLLSIWHYKARTKIKIANFNFLINEKKKKLLNLQKNGIYIIKRLVEIFCNEKYCIVTKNLQIKMYNFYFFNTFSSC
uniref:Uncharacterized protein n=1 Tax=Cacopsylla melanoneura TaxID=428564 RepID=A0A8D8QDT8_9HEMI